MDKIKVLLQYPWKFPDSSYYKNILENPPENVEYVNFGHGGKGKTKKIKIIGSSKKFEYMRVFKNVLRKFLYTIKLPNITFGLFGKYDLIHCAHCLVITKKPWVVDTEVYDRLGAFGDIAYSKLGKWIIKKFFISRNCKKIIAWSEDCKKTIIDAFHDEPEIIKKVDMVPFSFPAPKFKKINHPGKTVVLFLARWFDAKGGRQTLEIMGRLVKKYKDVECLFICPTPKEFKKKYSCERIKIFDLMPQEKLFRDIYPYADVFLYPGFGDSYGFAMPEALSFGLPIVTVDAFARREIVKDNKNGFIIPKPKDFSGYCYMGEKMLTELFDKTCLLIENPSLRKKMGIVGIKEVKSGLFSIKNMNNKLSKIYDYAVLKSNKK
jgi:glycosyltransferase involved in cell wall biosynthesis